MMGYIEIKIGKFQASLFIFLKIKDKQGIVNIIMVLELQVPSKLKMLQDGIYQL